MTAPGGLSLARVTIAAPKRRMDVALPDNMVIGELLPHLLRHAGEDLADEGERHGGWVLHRATGVSLEPNRNLSTQGVRDGELLHLVPGRVDWPELAYDDVVEVIASGARQAGRSWSKRATRACGLAVGAVVISLGLLAVALSGPPWPMPASAALGVAALLMVIGIVVSRAMADAGAGAVIAGSGLLYAFAGGALVITPDSANVAHLGAPSMLLGSGLLILFSVIGYTAVAAMPRVFAAGLAAGLTSAIAAVAALAGMPSDGAAALALVMVLVLLPGYPLFSSWMGRLPVPELPDRPEGILEDRPVPPRADVFRSVARASEMLSGMLLSTAVVSAIAIVFLVTSGDTLAITLSATASGVLLLRGRLFPSTEQRIPLLTSGLLGLALLAIAGIINAPAGSARLIYLLGLALAGLVVLTAGLIYSRRPPSPYLGRIADIVDVLAIMALVPLACGVFGLFGAIRGLFASFGG